MDFRELSQLVQKGDAKKVKELVNTALEEKIDPEQILNEGLISAMSEVGIKFQNDEIYVPEMLIAARAMSAGMQILEPILVAAGVKAIGTAVIGTVRGDLHDIGKNLVRMMLKGAGIDVYDLGTDVTPEMFANKAEEVGAQIICLSALLTTTMPVMKEVIDEFIQRGIRNKYIFMIGGAPITTNYANQIGADYYAEDGATAAAVAKSLLVG